MDYLTGIEEKKKTTKKETIKAHGSLEII